MPSVLRSDPPVKVAIVGGGIIGLVLALGLIKRNVDVKVYEQARSLREIGAGVAFTANAIRCMALLEPGIVDALRSVATSNGDPKNPNDYLQWVDGYNEDKENPQNEKVLFKLYAGTRGFEGCHRAHFLEALVKIVPEGTVEFGKRLDTINEQGDKGKVSLKFLDGTSAEADAVIGCDGIKSRVRQLLLGEENPASYPKYSYKYAYRGLIPMDKAMEVLGEYKAKNQHMHIGPKAHMLHFPVANQKLMNFVAFVSDPNEWQDADKMDVPATREEVEVAFASWGPVVRSIATLLPDVLDKWAIFDSYDNPAPYYSKGRVCIAGDAAHAAAPHHGAGAGIGVEDALCLATLLEKAMIAIEHGKTEKNEGVELAFDIYNEIRKERSQWLVKSSREVCDIYEWANPETGNNPDKCFEEIKWRSHKIWYFDYDGMLKDAIESYDSKLTATEGLLDSSSSPTSLESEQ